MLLIKATFGRYAWTIIVGALFENWGSLFNVSLAEDCIVVLTSTCVVCILVEVMIVTDLTASSGVINSL